MATIMVVDDSKFQRNTIISEIKKLSHEAISAENGKAALELLETAKPDAIITDLHMPTMDGFEMLGHLQAAGNTIPVVVLSADVQSSTFERAQQLGAKAFMEKPLNAEKLKGFLDKL